MPTVLETVPIVMENFCVFLTSGHNHLQYSFCLPRDRLSGWVGLSGLVRSLNGLLVITSVLTQLDVEILCYCANDVSTKPDFFLAVCE